MASANSPPSQPCPAEAADRIASAILEALDASGGKLAVVDSAALRARFPRYPAEVDRQLAELRSVQASDQRIGHYLVGRRLGRGSGGVVYEALDTRLKRKVALKKFDAPLAGRQNELEREATALAALRHPHIVDVYALEEHEEAIVIVMELVQGVSLDRLVRTAKQPPPQGSTTGWTLPALIAAACDASALDKPAATALAAATAVAPASAPQSPSADYCREIAAALAGAADGLGHAHSKGTVHRDIKPGNLLIDRDSTVKVGDFGLAKGEALLSLSCAGRFLGTPYYASPEQANTRAPIDKPTDIWSLGATLYELVTLQLPFQGKDEDEVLSRIQRAELVPPRRVNPNVPADLDHIICRCLAKDPVLRYPSAAALGTDLRQCAQGAALVIANAPLLLRCWSALRRPTVRTTLTFAASVIVLAGLVFTGAKLWKTAEQRADIALQRAALLDSAKLSFDEGVAQPNAAALHYAVALAVSALQVGEGGDAQQVQLYKGRVAFEEGRMKEATDRFHEAEFGGKAESGRPAPPAAAPPTLAFDDRTLAARAAFAAGDFAEATRLYTACLVEADTSTAKEAPSGTALRNELRLVGAFSDAKTIPWLARQVQLTALDIRTMENVRIQAPLVPTLLALRRTMPQPIGTAGFRLLMANADAVEATTDWRDWTPSAALSGIAPMGTTPQAGLAPEELFAVAFAVGDIDGKGGDDIAVVCEYCTQNADGGTTKGSTLHVAYAPFSLSEGPKWQPLTDPLQDIGKDYAGRTVLCIVPAQESVPAQLVIGRHRTLARLIFTAAEQHAEREEVHSDVTFVRATQWQGKQALVIGQGAWRRYGFELRTLGPGAIMAPVGFAAMGLPQDALVFSDAATSTQVTPRRNAFQDLLLVVPGGMHWAANQITFGELEPRGAAFGIHALQLDRPTHSFLPQCSVTLPRPRSAKARLHLADFLDGTPSVALSVGAAEDGADPAVTLAPFTMLYKWIPAGPSAALEPRLRLPGALLSATSNGSAHWFVSAIARGPNGGRAMALVRVQQ